MSAVEAILEYDEPPTQLGFIPALIGAAGAAASAIMPIIGAKQGEKDAKKAEKRLMQQQAAQAEIAAERAFDQRQTLMRLGAALFGLAVVGGAIYVTYRVVAGPAPRRRRNPRKIYRRNRCRSR